MAASRSSRLRSVAAGAALTMALSCVATGAANGYTVLGATFVPDYGTVGSRIVVMGLPLAVDCPTVDVWLSRAPDPQPPIESSADPRLVRLSGRNTSIAQGVAGSGPERTFTFRVPDLEPGTYATWAACRGANSFGDLGPGHTTFRVVPGLPATDASPAGAMRGASGRPAMTGMALGAFGFLSVLATAAWLGRRRRLPR